MLDLRFIRTHPEKVKEAMAKRNADAPVAALLAADDRWRRGLAEVERLKAERNDVSRHIGELKRSGDDATEALERMKTVAARIKALDDEVAEAEADVQRLLFDVPNITHDSVPYGVSDDDNVELKRVGEPRSFSFTPSAHWDIGTSLDILDFERAGKLAGARFSAFKGVGARLERALIQFMLDLHIDEHGYTELMTPVIANRQAMTGTGQLPKFEDDMFRLEGLDYYLIPTAEVSMTNWHRDEILTADALPKYYVGYTPCFRAEAGAHGRDTRGLIRNHQFDKVELVKLCMPEHSYDELEKLTANAEKVLELLELPYRRVVLCSGDTGFSAAKTYDLEVWMPSYDRYVEISSCSNFEDFQARRARLRFRRQPGEKAEFVHTLNGSGLAVGRTFAALLENHQNEDGTVNIPEALRPYMGGRDRIARAEGN